MVDSESLVGFKYNNKDMLTFLKNLLKMAMEERVWDATYQLPQLTPEAPPLCLSKTPLDAFLYHGV